MKNVKIEVDKNKIMTITVDLKKDFGASSSGKTTIVATTGGNQPVEDEVMVGLNVYKYPESKKTK